MKIREFIKESFPFAVRAKRSVDFYRYYLLLKMAPVYLTKRRYNKAFKGAKRLNLKNPRDLNEKIQWLKLYSDTSMWSDLADKYKVREFIKQQGYGDMLNELYGVWKSPDEIDFSTLPDRFVLKTNNGSGDVIVVKDKSKIDEKEIRHQLKNNLARRFGVRSAEPHYLKIEPRIICEKLLEQNSDLSSSLIDYKFYCTKGKIIGLMVCFDRVIGGHAEKIIYDIDNWQPHFEYVREEYKSSASTKPIPRPKSFDQMKEAARALSKQFPLVRVDFYEVNERPLFGEMTFTSETGCIPYLTDEYLIKLGDMVTL